MFSFTRIVFSSLLDTLLLLLSIIVAANGENIATSLNVTDESKKEGDVGMEASTNFSFTNPNALLKEGPNDQQLSVEILKELLNAQIFLNGSEGTGNGKQSPMRKKQKTKPPELSCNPQEKSMCAYARLCVHRENSTNFECICHRGYGGRFCQFSLFPRSCADALAFHEEEEENVGEGFLPNVDIEEGGEEHGQWRQLDIDGSGPLPATFAECFSNGGRTIVGHNIPQGQPFVVRNETFNNQSAFYPISYKLFSNAHLRALIDRSEYCRQIIRFDCEQSPLDFKNNQTWLQIAHREGQQFRQIGSQPFSCACRDKELYGCGRDEFTCYCDDLSQQSTMDQAILHNKSAAVTALYLRKNEMQPGGKQWITLGPLECAGEAGTSQNALVTLRSLSAHLETGAFHGWRQLELDFRTWQPDIEKMVTGWSPVGLGEMQLKISLRAGHRIELTLSHQNVEEEGEDKTRTEEEEDEDNDLEGQNQQKRQPPQMIRRQPKAIRREMTVSIASPRPLNDLFWHRLHVEMFRNEVRFSIDRLNAFQPLTFPFPVATKFRLGGDEQGNGFVGCVGNFRVDQRLVDWRSQLVLREVEDIRVAPGCTDLCQENQCQQGARCVEHFDTQTNDCECSQPRIHFGEHCEKNVNENSSIVLDGTGFLRFENLVLSTLHADLVFSARTDQKRALLLYEHDELDNVVQIHLANEYRIVLSVNNLSRILHCTIDAKMGKVFNNMEWMQFVLERDGQGGIVLNVNDQNCQIGGKGKPILMSANEKEGSNIEGGNGRGGGTSSEEYDAILPPVPLFASQFSPTRPRFNFLFIGGLPRVTRTKRKEKKAEKRMPLYLSNIPSLKGCIRGMLIDGEKLDLKEIVANGTNILGRIEGVQIGCEEIERHCAGLNCQNGGECKVNWHLTQNSVQCDCSTTSFGGTNCTEDIGLKFPGNFSIIFDLAHPKRFSFLGDSERQTLAFSFKAVQNANGKWPQQLATIYFEDGHQMHIQMNQNNVTSFLAIGIFPKNGSLLPISMHKFDAANFTDGHRHFFRAHFFARKSPLISLDGWRHQFNGLEEVLNLANAKMFYFVGKTGMEEKADGDDENREEMENIINENSEENGKIGTKIEAEDESTTLNGLKRKEENKVENTLSNVNGPEQILISDAMREIMAKRRSAMDGGNETANENDEMMEEKEDEKKKENEGREEDETKWSKRVHHFEGIISNVAIEFERESSSSSSNILRFTPLLYYLQEEEFLHRSVRTDPLDIPGGKLLPASAGPFHLPPKPIPPPPRIVPVPNWEAPLRRVPFPDWDLFAMNVHKEGDQFAYGQEPQNNNSLIWIVSLLLILLLLLAICCCCCCFCVSKKRRTTESADFYAERKVEGKPEKKPMLGKIKMKENGIGKKVVLASEEKFPIQLRLQRPLNSPPPPRSPVQIPKVVVGFTDPAQVKPPRSILRTPGQRKKAPPPGSIKIPDHFERVADSKAQCDESAASSSGTTAYFTANDHFVSDSSATSSFVSLEQPDPSTTADDSSIIGANANDEDEDDGFAEKAPSELMDEKMLELTNGDGNVLFDETPSSSTSSIQLPHSSPSPCQSQNGPSSASFANSLICAAPETPETLTAASRAEGEEAEEQSTLNISG